MATVPGLFTSKGLVMAAIFRALAISGRKWLRYISCNIGLAHNHTCIPSSSTRSSGR